MTIQKLQLRGHHISLFANWYLGESYCLKMAEEMQASIAETRALLDRIVNHKSHIEIFLESKPWKNWWPFKKAHKKNEPIDYVSMGYGQPMSDTVNSFWNVLKTQPDLEVEIVEGLDSICLADCPKLKSSCMAREENETGEDSFTLRQYGLEVGKKYTSKELRQIIEGYAKKIGIIRSPRDGIYYLGKPVTK